MDIKIIFIKTSKGEEESKRITNHLSSDIKRALGLIDNKSTVKELMKRAAPSLRESLDDMLQELIDGGFIQDKDKVSSVVKMAIPRMPIQKSIVPSPKFESREERQDPIGIRNAAEQEVAQVKAEAVRLRAEQEAALARAKAEAETDRLKVEQEATRIKAEQEAALARAKAEAETARLKAEQETEKIRTELEVALVKAKVEAEAETRARADAEASRLKAEQEVVKARTEQEAALARAKAEAETARLKAEQETEKIRTELEAALVKAKVEAEARAHADDVASRLRVEKETVKARAEQEAALARAKAEAEMARIKAEQETEKVRTELEAALVKAKEEAGALAKARSEAETVRLKAEQETSKVRSELKAEQAKLQVEAKAKARAEAETARLKGEQEAVKIIVKQEAAQAKAKVEMDAKMRAEAEVTRIKEEQEALATLLDKEKAEAKARDEAAARIKVEQDAAKIRVEQETVQTVAKAKMEAAVKTQQAAQVPEMKAVQHVAITRSKPLPWGKIAAGLIVLLFLLAALLPYIWPMQGYVTQIEQKLSAQLQQPVHVGHLRATLLPQPKLELEDVSMGGSQELKASSVVLNFDFSALLSEIKAIQSMEISDLILSAENFDKVLLWLQTAGGDTHYPVARMVLQRGRVSDDELSLPPVNGVVNFDGQRRFAKAVLKSEDGKLSMELQPQQSRWQIALAIKQGYVPLLPNILFNELTIKGELGAGEIKFHEIDGRLYGGMLAGSAHLTWLKGWQMQGLVNVKAMQLHDALPQFGIVGEMDGDANFILRGEKLPLLAKTPYLDGKFLVKKGLINTIDMVETSRMPTRKVASNGRTHFDELSGVLQIDNNKKHLRQIKISAGVMSANGYVDITENKQLSGRLNVDLKIRADLGSVPLVLSGTLTEPVWGTKR
ncbi:MAG: AsmA-like C-terminal region [Candidatus Nitrotoga sp. CP45]|nr:MAG: AsmA-like C-terminal region [Candidatus Nitrotoga sp. CP45]